MQHRSASPLGSKVVDGIDSAVAHERVEIGWVEAEESAHLVVPESVLEDELADETLARTQVGSGRLDAEPVRRIGGSQRIPSGGAGFAYLLLFTVTA